MAALALGLGCAPRDEAAPVGAPRLVGFFSACTAARPEELPPGLERTWLEHRLACLEAGAEIGEWQALFEGQLPRDLEARARRGLSVALLQAGETESAASLLFDSGAAGDLELLLDLDDQGVVEQAARLLAVSAPRRLGRADRALDRAVAASLDPAAKIERARALIAAGAPRQASTELSSWRDEGRLEEGRLIELARAQLATGASTRALSVLAGIAGADAALVRAEAHRKRGWQLHPSRAADAQFRAVIPQVEAIVESRPEAEFLVAALRLRLEAATELGLLEPALADFRALEALGWEDERRAWLGRRLGIGLAWAGRADLTFELIEALPEHARCLRYWSLASSGEERRRGLEDLAAAPIGDLYSSWARRELGLGPLAPTSFLPGPQAAPIPGAVSALVMAGRAGLARSYWDRHLARASVEPAELLSAAIADRSGGRAVTAIRRLRRGFETLGSTEMADLPVEILRAYLPLDWSEELRQAASTNRLEPALVAALARQESVFVATARSPAGAIGLLQMMPGTARAHARAIGLGSRPDLRDPVVNLRLGSRELRAMIDRFDGRLEAALAAYNAGPGRPQRWLRREPRVERMVEQISIPETYGYVRSVVFLQEAYRAVWPELR